MPETGFRSKCVALAIGLTPPVPSGEDRMEDRDNEREARSNALGECFKPGPTVGLSCCPPQACLEPLFLDGRQQVNPPLETERENLA